MTDTVLASEKREVVIGFDRPFVMIGERINPTGRKVLAAELARGDLSRVERDALAQVQAGAAVLDVNAGVTDADEPRLMSELVELVQSLTDAPLCTDSSSDAALASGLGACRGKPLVNSVTGEEERLETVLPLVKRHGAAVVAICNDDRGVSPDPDVRFAVARKILERALDHGIPAADVVVDPLVMPVGCADDAARSALEVASRVRRELRLNTVCGVSNVSFGLSRRDRLNATFVAMLIGSGLTSAIVSPLHAEVVDAITSAEVMAGVDRRCKRWLQRCRRLAAQAA